uniref:Ubiquitin-like domain-containing protein n=1 Tax=Meloidogyne javanica TaxID=6303 RepID=A0A915MXA9_MELJA
MPEVISLGSDSSEEIVCVDDFVSSTNFCTNNSSIPAVIEINSPSCSNSIEVIDLTPFGSSLTNNCSNKIYKAQKSKNIIPSPKSTCTITIHSNGGKRMFIQDLDDPIKNLIEDYAERVNGDPKRIVLITKQLKQCALEDTPRTLGITSDESFELDAFEHKDVVPLNSMEDVKTIRIKYQQKGKRPIVAKILKTAKFARLKEIFCQENSLPLDKVLFIFDSVRVGDNETAETLDLEDDDCIDKYHPDMNPDNKDKASKYFHEVSDLNGIYKLMFVSEAYEILGSKEKRRAYDSLTAEMPTKIFKATHHQRTKAGEKHQRKWEKDWSDLDIDYKDFEHFQNMSRKKRMFHGSATNTSENFWAAQHEAASNYRSNLAREREIRERQLHLQFEERRRREEHPMPTFEKLRLQSEKLEQEERKKRFYKYLAADFPSLERNRPLYIKYLQE